MMRLRRFRRQLQAHVQTTARSTPSRPRGDPARAQQPRSRADAPVRAANLRRAVARWRSARRSHLPATDRDSPRRELPPAHPHGRRRRAGHGRAARDQQGAARQRAVHGHRAAGSVLARQSLSTSRASSSGGHVTLPADVDDAVRQAGASCLVLITKHRGRCSPSRSTTGSSAAASSKGSASTSTLSIGCSDERDRPSAPLGFLAPFVYVDVTLVDVASHASPAPDHHHRLGDDHRRPDSAKGAAVPGTR